MAVFKVANQSQLDSAVINARDGDTILLSSGTYSRLEMVSSRPSHSHVDFNQKVTIASADPSKPAIINQLLLRGAENVELKGLKLDYVASKTSSTPFVIESTSKITLNNVDLEGHVSSGFGTGLGLRVTKSNNFALLNSEVSDFRNGLNITNSSDVTVSGTDFRGMSNDSMLVGGVTRMLIENNDFRAMKSPASLKHKDMIQFYDSASIAPARDIVIRGNVMENPEVTHAIFFGNALADAGNLSAYYRNILVEDNYIRSAQIHGVTIDHGTNVTIRDNTIVNNPDLGYKAMVNIPLINVSTLSTYVTITGNKVESVPKPQNGTWKVSGNDTGTKNVVHWDGGYGSAKTSASSFALAAPAEETVAPPDDAPAAGGGDSGGGELFRVNGRSVDGETRFLVETLDFARGDVIVFNKFDPGSFVNARDANPLHVWSDGGGAKLDAVADLRELANSAPEVTAATRAEDDLLILRVAQDDGVAEIVFEGLGAAFRSAPEPDLF